MLFRSVIIEVIGKPKEHVGETLKGYVENIKKKEDIEILQTDFDELKEFEGDQEELFVSIVELELLAKNIPTLIGFCFDYMPSSIDIIEPKELKIKDVELSTIMNDLQGKLHKLDMGAKQLSNENKFLMKNTFFLATNLVAVLLRPGPKNLKDLSRLTGMNEKDCGEFLEKLIKQEFVKKEEGKYSWIKKDE